MPGKTMMISLATGAAVAGAAAAYGYYRRSGGDDFYDDDGDMPSGDGSSWTSRDLYGANNATAPASTTPRSSSFNEREGTPYMPAGASVSEGRNSSNNQNQGEHT